MQCKISHACDKYPLCSCVLCLDIDLSILFVWDRYNRLGAVGNVCWDEVLYLPAMGEPRSFRYQWRSCCHRHSSLLFVHPSLEYSCAYIFICHV